MPPIRYISHTREHLTSECKTLPIGDTFADNRLLTFKMPSDMPSIRDWEHLSYECKTPPIGDTVADNQEHWLFTAEISSEMSAIEDREHLTSERKTPPNGDGAAWSVTSNRPSERPTIRHIATDPVLASETGVHWVLLAWFGVSFLSFSCRDAANRMLGCKSIVGRYEERLELTMVCVASFLIVWIWYFIVDMIYN